MGYDFQNKQRTIWSPGQGTALCFLAQVRYLEVRLQMPSGLTEIMSDTIDVDYAQLSAFLIHFGQYANFDNRSLNLLLKGTSVHLLALFVTAGSLQAELRNLFPANWVEVACGLLKVSMDTLNTDVNATEPETLKP